MILATISAFILSFLTSLCVIRFSHRTGKMLDKDESNKPQKMHFGDTPRAGGIGIFVAFVLGIALCVSFELLEKRVLWLLVPLFIIFISGIIEDFNGALSPKKRLALQILGSAVAVFAFNCVLVDIGFALPYAFGVVFSIFCIVGIINALNIIDGFNGLSSGYALMVLFSMAIVSAIVGNFAVLHIAIILIGAIFGFFVLNFPRGRIFLGDGGAYLVGFLLAFLLILLTQNQADSSFKGTIANLKSEAKSLQIVVFNTKSSNQDSRESWRDSGDSSNSSANRDSISNRDSSNLRDSRDSSANRDLHDSSDSRDSKDSSDSGNSIANLDSSDSRESPQISAFYGLCIMIYAVFEVLFSIWRRVTRKISALEADKIHLHTLIFKRVTHDNPKTSALLWLFNAPFIFAPIFCFDNTLTLMSLIVAFVALYLFIYARIVALKSRFFKSNKPKIQR